MDGMNRILGSVYGGIIGQACGRWLDNHKSNFKSPEYLKISAYIKEHLFLSTHVLKVFHDGCLNNRQVPSTAYLSYILWTYKNLKGGSVKELQYTHRTIMNYRHLNNYLKASDVLTRVKAVEANYIPVFLEFEDLYSHLQYNRRLLTLNKSVTDHGIQNIHNHMMFVLGKTQDVKAVFKTVNYLEGSFSIFYEPLLKKKAFVNEDRQRACLEYYKILKELSESKSFEESLNYIIHNSSKPSEYGMLAGNLLGKYHGFKKIPDQLIKLLYDQIIF